MTLVLASLIVLAAGAAASIIFRRFPRAALATSMSAVGIAALFVVIASLEILLRATAGTPQDLSWSLPLGTARLAVDGLSAWFLMTIGLLAFCVAIYTTAYMRDSLERGPIPAFGAQMCALMASLILVVCAADAVLFLIAWEAMTLSAFLLVSFDHDRPEVRRGAWMYLVATHIGTALCVLPLFSVMSAAARTTAFSAFPSGLQSADRSTVTILFALGLLGFGTKAGFLPMHVWLPAAHPVAPTPVSAFLSGVVVKTGLYGLLRLLTWLPPLPPVCGQALLVAGIVSGVMGVLYALAQHDMKRLLAYHTVENIGIIAIGIAAGMLGQAANEPVVAVLGYAGALLHVTNHAVFKGLLFLSAGTVLHGTGTVEIERLGGLAKKTPANALMFLTGAVAICGLPPLNGFISEWIIYGSLFAGSQRGLGAAGAVSALGILSLALMGGLALACFAKVFGIVFLGERRDETLPAHSTPFAMKLGMSILAASCVLIGILSSLWIPLTYPAVAKLARVSEGELQASIHGVVSSGSRLSMLVLVLAGLAAGLAILRTTVLGRGARRVATKAPAIASTWGCGYAHPTPRMQYTATSFASPLITGFRGLLWPERTLVAPAGLFPGLSHVESHVPDLAEHDVFEPLFRGSARLFAMVQTVSWSGITPRAPVRSGFHVGLRPLKTLVTGMVGALRRGAIHVQLLFIVLTLLTLFLIEGLSATRATSATATQEPQAPASSEMNP